MLDIEPKPKPFWRLNIAAKSRQILLRIGFVSLVLNLLILTSPIYMIQVYDRVLSSQSTDTLLLLTIVMVALFGLYGFLFTLRDRLFNRWGVWIVGVFSDEALRQDIDRSRDAGATSLRSNQDLRRIGDFILGPMKQIIDLPFAPIFLIVAFIIHPAFPVFSVLTIIALGLSAYGKRRAVDAVGGQFQGVGVESGALLEQSVWQADILQTLGMQRMVRHRLSLSRRSVFSSMLMGRDKGGVYDGLDQWIRNSSQSLTIGLAAFLVILGDISPGLLLAASVIHGKSIAPFGSFFTAWPRLKELRMVLERFDAGIKSPSEAPTLDEDTVYTHYNRVSGDILAVADVQLSGGKSAPAVLKDISFRLNGGEVLMVLGAPASGPDALCAAIAGQCDVDAGYIGWRGHSITSYDPETRGQHIGYVGSSAMLFSGTVGSNIARFDSEATPGDVEAAAVAAGCHEMIMALPQGYDTVLGDYGSGISPSLKNLIAWARALYGSPELVILNRPPLATDPETKAPFLASLMRLRETGVAILINASDQHLMMLADTVMELRDGKIVRYQPRQDFIRAQRLQQIADLRNSDDFDDDDEDDDDDFEDDDLDDDGVADHEALSNPVKQGDKHD